MKLNQIAVLATNQSILSTHSPTERIKNVKSKTASMLTTHHFRFSIFN